MAQCLSPPRDDKMLQSHSIGGTMLQSPARDEIMLQSHARDETMLQSPSIYDTGRISAQCKNFVASPEIQMSTSDPNFHVKFICGYDFTF